MSLAEISDLLDEYHAWLREKTTLREVGKWVEITSPLVDRHNDCLQLYAMVDNGTIQLTDDGWTIQDLEASGCRLDTPKRRDLLEVTLRGFGVQLDGARITATATRENFALRKHSVLQAMLAINDLFALAQPTVESVFLEDVQAWLDANEVRYTERIPFVGQSGYQHLFDFVIPRSKEQPERILKVINAPRRDAAVAVAFSWVDTREARPSGARAYAFLNDAEKTVAASVTEALTAYDIRPVPWSRRQDVRNELAA